MTSLRYDAALEMAVTVFNPQLSQSAFDTNTWGMFYLAQLHDAIPWVLDVGEGFSLERAV